MTEEKIIFMENIQMVFGDKKALDGVSLTVPKGEIFGLLGPSGAGKTTMIKILTGQLNATQGKSSIFGYDTERIPDEVYAKIGMVLDTTGLYTRLTAYDNLKVFTDIFGIDKSEIGKSLRAVQLEDSSKKVVSKLSKGMTQRLVFARAIINNPSLLFLDEPTSGLDPATAQEIHRIIFDLRDRGATVFLTTHNMTEATNLCDRVALLNDGKIIELDAPKALCSKYNTDQKIHVLLKNGKEEVLSMDEKSADMLSDFIKSNQIDSIHSSEPDLETVFISLTGRKLV